MIYKVYLEPTRTSKMENFSVKQLTIFEKRSIVDVQLGSKYPSATHECFIREKYHWSAAGSRVYKEKDSCCNHK